MIANANESATNPSNVNTRALVDGFMIDFPLLRTVRVTKPRLTKIKTTVNKGSITSKECGALLRQCLD